MQARLPIAVLVSGSGSNLQAILDAAADDGFSAEVRVVISDREGVHALTRAAAAAIPAEVVAWADHGDRDAFTAAVCDVATRHGAEALVLAGFLRILGDAAIGRFPERIVNIHPSLLPAFGYAAIGVSVLGTFLLRGLAGTGLWRGKIAPGAALATGLIVFALFALVPQLGPKRADELAEKVKNIMSAAAQLDVKLKVDAGLGQNWDEAH